MDMAFVSIQTLARYSSQLAQLVVALLFKTAPKPTPFSYI